MDGWICVSFRVFVEVRCMDGWTDSVSLRYSFCGKLDGWIDG